jgi:hypothetical protein
MLPGLCMVALTVGLWGADEAGEPGAGADEAGEPGAGADEGGGPGAGVDEPACPQQVQMKLASSGRQKKLSSPGRVY